MTNADAQQLRLAAEFPPASSEQWLALVEQVLKGAPFERKLVTRTYDGLAIQPLYSGAPDARPLAARAAAAPWQIMQRIDLPDPGLANSEALHELANGATGLTLVFAGAIGGYGCGLKATETALARTLEGVHVDAGIAIELDLSPPAKDAALSLAHGLSGKGIAPAVANIRFGFDPLGAMAAAGGAPASWPNLAPLFSRTVADLVQQGFKGPFAAADGRMIHAAGGSEAQELAFVLATALAYLRAFEAGGIAPDAGRRLLFFRLAADADQFLTMAKFRALRRLWAGIEQACGMTPEPVFIAAETAWRMMTRRDPWVNILRTTIAAFSAGLGGANAVTVLPFTAALGLPDRSARRLARNLQLILLEEANLAKVTDPVAGSGGVADLTDQLCRTAWAQFQEIEAAGGAFAALAGQLIQRKVATVRAEREQAIATREDALTGTSQFPDLAEPSVAVASVSPVPVLGPEPRVVEFEPLSRTRSAEPFERLRDASDRLLRERGSRPRIFLANLGKPSDFTARAMFAKNFFEAGGIEAIAGDVSEDPEAMKSAFKASGADFACLCSSDDVYARAAAKAAKALAAAGARHIYLAGRPSAIEPALKQAGVGSFIHAGCDALATLQGAHDILTKIVTAEASAQ